MTPRSRRTILAFLKLSEFPPVPKLRAVSRAEVFTNRFKYNFNITSAPFAGPSLQCSLCVGL